MKKVIGALLLIILSFYLIKVGIKHEGPIETETNADILCLSCIGIE